MKKDNVLLPVCFASIYFLVYLVLLTLPGGFHLALLMLLCSPFVLVWLVVAVLKKGRPGPYSFDDRWYEDQEK